MAGGGAINRIAKWNGSSWLAMGSGTSDSILALAVFDVGDEPALHAGGAFDSAFASGDSFLAAWGFDATPPVLSCPPVVAFDGFGGTPGRVVTFSVTATDDLDPAPGIVCVPPSGSFFPRGTTIVNCWATDACDNQATCQFTVTVEVRARKDALGD